MSRKYIEINLIGQAMIRTQVVGLPYGNSNYYNANF